MELILAAQIKPEFPQTLARIAEEINRTLAFRGWLAAIKHFEAAKEANGDSPQVFKIEISETWLYEGDKIAYLRDWLGAKLRNLTLVSIVRFYPDPKLSISSVEQARKVG
jgi:hypothetical protein